MSYFPLRWNCWSGKGGVSPSLALSAGYPPLPGVPQIAVSLRCVHYWGIRCSVLHCTYVRSWQRSQAVIIVAHITSSAADVRCLQMMNKVTFGNNWICGYVVVDVAAPSVTECSARWDAETAVRTSLSGVMDFCDTFIVS
jgi:hypothetical protein